MISFDVHVTVSHFYSIDLKDDGCMVNWNTFGRK